MRFSKSSSVVVIPIYRETIPPEEGLSLRRCLHVFASRKLVFAAPTGMNLTAYESVCGDRSVAVERYPAKYFRSIESYSLLLIKPLFYERFKQFEYLLIYQLDAYVFRDDLDEWCAKSYDYIGAPWLKSAPNGDMIPCGVGNGGFCLRKVSTFLNFGRSRFPVVFTRNELKVLHYDKVLKVGSLSQRLIAHVKMLLKATGWRNHPGYYAKHYTEDDFWCGLLSEAGVPLRIAPHEEAARFAFEAFPDVLYDQLGQVLPFGCHAWQRYKKDFWLQFIEHPEKEFPGDS